MRKLYILTVIIILLLLGCSGSHRKSGTKEFEERVLNITEFHSEKWYSSTVTAYTYVGNRDTLVVATEDLIPRSGNISSMLYILDSNSQIRTKQYLSLNRKVNDLKVLGQSIIALTSSIDNSDIELISYNKILVEQSRILLDKDLDYSIVTPDNRFLILSYNNFELIIHELTKDLDMIELRKIKVSNRNLFLTDNYIYLQDKNTLILYRYSLKNTDEVPRELKVNKSDIDTIVFSNENEMIYIQNHNRMMYWNIRSNKKTILSECALPIARIVDNKIYYLSYLNAKELSGTKLTILHPDTNNEVYIPLLKGHEYRVESMQVIDHNTIQLQGTRLKIQYKLRRRSLGYFITLSIEPHQIM